MRFTHHCIERISTKCLILTSSCLVLSGLSMPAQSDATSSKSKSVSDISLPADPVKRREMYRHVVSGGVPVDLPHFTAVSLLGLEDKDPEVRAYAARGLHLIDETREKEVVTALGRRLADPAEGRFVKYEALFALSSLKSPIALTFWDDVATAFTDGGSELSKLDARISKESYCGAAASVLLSSGGVKKALPVFETAKDAAAKSGALSALNGLGDRTKGQFAVDEEGREQVRNFMLKHLEDESADVRKCALQGMLFVVRQRADAKTAADLEGNLQIKQALEKHLETETDELLKTWTEGLLSLYRKEPRPGMGTIPLPPETTP